jgi:hypothetical protein
MDAIAHFQEFIGPEALRFLQPTPTSSSFS